MSMPKEYDYIGLSENSSVERISDKVSSSSSSSSTLPTEENGNNNKTSSLNLKETELRLGLPGYQSQERKSLPGVSLFGKDIDTDTNGGDNGNTQKTSVCGPAKQDVVGVFTQSSKPIQEKSSQLSGPNENSNAPAAKAQVVGWPPIRSFRKNTMASNATKKNEDAESKSGFGCLYVKVSMDGAPYLRKIDLKTYSNYVELSSALEKMFSCFTIGPCGTHGLPGRDGLSETCLKDILHGSEYVLTYEDKDGDWMLVGDVPWEMFTDSCRRLRIMKGSEAIGLAPRSMEKCKNRN
ncbi:auxin-responsive protein IAA27 isoform X2 [Manihot esculenta]|uniref:Uncharacterized protein n=1 Tax=Manihot esculenta TaxID=3983 RepID=A0ACB7HWQ9_MANES|nr:auxin-responsive protein IAA27 isoform X2 [Manihot esculenta]KAG8656405.1 hypothetical protein MANES_04G131300v8 [Manihot esculenta]